MKTLRKLKSRKGFTLAETLMAILILLLVSTIVATGVPVAKDAYEKVVLSANAQTLLSTAVSALRDEVGTAWDVRVDTTPSSKAILYYSAQTGARTRLCVGEYTVGGETKQILLVQDNYQEAALGPTGSTTGVGGSSLGTARPVAQDSNKGGATALYVTCAGIGYDKGIVTFTDLQVLTVGGTELAKLPSLTVRVASYVGP